MVAVSDMTEDQSAQSISAALCVDREAFDRFGHVLRHLLVGLVDQAVSLRLLSCDARVDALSLGPVRTLIHKRLVWPFARRRIEELLGALSHQPPRIVHALSGASYGVASAIAEAFDADLVLQVTSLADCNSVIHFAGEGRATGSSLRDRLSSRSRDGLESPSHTHPAARFLAFTEPLRSVLQEQVKIPAEQIDLVRPGVLASQHIACFADPKRAPTILCLSSLERGSGVDRLIEAIGILRRRDHPLMLFLLGEGRQESALRRDIRERKLSSCVILAHPAGDLSRAMQSADIFVRPSSDSAVAEQCLQAMGAGMAVVTCESAVCDYFRDGETAVLCAKPKAESLAGAIEELLNDRGAARRIATSGLEYVRAHHAMSRMAEDIASTYRRLALTRATFPLQQ